MAKKSIKQRLKALWEKINGKKTLTGLAMHIAWAAVHLSVGQIDLDTGIEGHIYIGSITGVGAGHKLLKSKFGSKLINLIKK